MSQTNLYPHDEKPRKNSTSLLWLLFWVLGGGLAVLFGMGLAAFFSSPISAALRSTLSQVFAVDSVQLMWYITRSAGMVAYVLLWLSTAWGLAVSSKIFDQLLHRSFTYDFHQFISLLAIGFLILHIGVLMLDRYLPYSLAEILVPFLSPYRPLWVGIGVIGFYLTLLVTVTFYIRGHIGAKAFRLIHILSLLGYLTAALHSFFAGTDSPLGAAMLMYAGTFLVTVFLTSYWLIFMLQKKSRGLEQRPANLPRL